MIDVMQDMGRAIDLYVGELARRRKSPRTRADYERILQRFADTLPPYTAVGEVTVDQCRRFLDRWRDSSPSTLATSVSILRGFFRFQVDEGHVLEPGPMHRVQRPRRKRAEDLDVVTITEQDANRLLDACASWQEILCLTTALFTGRRRAALNAVRRRDVDLDRLTIRFRDKGDKVIVQRIPAQFAAIIEAADRDSIWTSPGDYLIPSRRPSTVTRPVRKDSLIWDTVKIVAARAGIDAHVHSLRAAFAVRFDDQHPDRIDTLRVLMGHDRLETTLVYLRRKDRARDQEVVDDLTWGGAPGSDREASNILVFPASVGVRPIRDSNPCSDDREQESLEGAGGSVTGVPLLDRKLAELSKRAARTRTRR